MGAVKNRYKIITLIFIMFIGIYVCSSIELFSSMDVKAEEAKTKKETEQQNEERKLKRDNSPVQFDKWGSVEENVIFDPGIAPQLKTLQDRGSFEPSDFLSEEEEEERENLVDIEVEMNPNNPIYLSGTGRMAGTGDVRQGFASSAAMVGSAAHPKALEISGLNLDEFGLVNWADAIRKGKISPLAGLTEAKIAAENYEEYIIVFQTLSDYMNDVVFPHDIHSYWLDCSNCHKKIFIPKAGANPVTMKKIVAGSYCGRCHGKVAFPLEECRRCHVKPKGGGAIQPYPLFKEFQYDYGFKN